MIRFYVILYYIPRFSLFFLVIIFPDKFISSNNKWIENIVIKEYFVRARARATCNEEEKWRTRGRDCNVEKRREIRNIRENRAISVQASQQSVFLPKIRSGAKLEPRTVFFKLQGISRIKSDRLWRKKRNSAENKKKKKNERQRTKRGIAVRFDDDKISRFAIARPVCGRLKFRVESGSRSRQL